MYQDLSVTVSAPVVRVLEKGYLVLDTARSTGFPSLLTNKEAKDVLQCLKTIERLFFWHEDALASVADFAMIYCRSLKWYRNVRRNLTVINGEGPGYLSELLTTGYSVLQGEVFHLDSFDELTELCAFIADVIWEHFIRCYWEASEFCD